LDSLEPVNREIYAHQQPITQRPTGRRGILSTISGKVYMLFMVGLCFLLVASSWLFPSGSTPTQNDLIISASPQPANTPSARVVNAREGLAVAELQTDAQLENLYLEEAQAQARINELSAVNGQITAQRQAEINLNKQEAEIQLSQIRGQIEKRQEDIAAQKEENDTQIAYLSDLNAVEATRVEITHQQNLNDLEAAKQKRWDNAVFYGSVTVIALLVSVVGVMWNDARIETRREKAKSKVGESAVKYIEARTGPPPSHKPKRDLTEELFSEYAQTESSEMVEFSSGAGEGAQHRPSTAPTPQNTVFLTPTPPQHRPNTAKHRVFDTNTAPAPVLTPPPTLPSTGVDTAPEAVLVIEEGEKLDASRPPNPAERTYIRKLYNDHGSYTQVCNMAYGSKNPKTFKYVKAAVKEGGEIAGASVKKVEA